MLCGGGARDNRCQRESGEHVKVAGGGDRGKLATHESYLTYNLFTEQQITNAGT
jgi:hypothetical protein